VFEFFKKLFKKDNQEQSLIDTLKKDHQKLIEVYTKISNAINKDDFEQTKILVKEFVGEYNKHILLEDVELYVALEEKYKEKKQILRTIKTIEKDMNNITKTITFFERKYKEITPNNKDLFLEEFRNIGRVLTQRVELEEERLYPLLHK